MSESRERLERRAEADLLIEDAELCELDAESWRAEGRMDYGAIMDARAKQSREKVALILGKANAHRSSASGGVA